MSRTQKKKQIKAENPTARQIHAEDKSFVYYCETTAGSIHITTDKDLGEIVSATKLIKWLR